MDLDNLNTATKSLAGVAMPLLHPTTDEPLNDDAGNPVTITLIGKDSKEYQEAERKLRNRRLKEVVKNAGRAKVTTEELEGDELKMLVMATKDWCGLTNKGQPFPYSPTNAETLYVEYPWVREQVSGFINNRANFLGN